jgi:hypothetical protein
LLGCLDTGAVPEQGNPADPVSVAVVSGKELRAKYGSSFRDNPFILSKPTIAQKTYDFVVLRLVISAASPTDMELLQADAVDGTGAVCADSYDRARFTDLAMQFSGPYMDNAAKSNRIVWYYLPSARLRVPTGNHVYLVVLVGTHPLPETVTARVRVLWAGEEKSFELPVNVADAG